MQEKYLLNYEVLKTCIVRVIDDLYDVLDATKQANISDSRTETMEKVVGQYELLLQHFKQKKELTKFEEAELMIIVNQVIASMQKHKERINKTLVELEKISQMFK